MTLHPALLLSVHGLIIAMGLLIYVMTTHSLQQRRSPTAAISWVLTMALIPYAGLPLYLFFGMRKLAHRGRRIPGKRAGAALHSDDAWPRLLAASMDQPPVVGYRNLHIHTEGRQALQSLWESIDGTGHELILCTFIIGHDAVGHELIARLIRKARAGVKVRLMIDSVGRMMGGWTDLRPLRAAGVQVVVQGRLLRVPFRRHANMRNHRKLLVADGARLWCGGRNLAAEYFGGDGKHEPWQDLSFDLEGPLAAQARELFERDWASALGAHKAESTQVAQSARGPFAQVIASGPDQVDDTVHDLLVTGCLKARKRIIAVTPYFVPTYALQKAMSLAARQGVIVDVILPEHSNHRMADLARHRALRELATDGVRVWLVPYMLHAKAVVIDDSVAWAGSANLDPRSLLLNYELMVAFYAGADVRRFARFADKHRQNSVRYSAHKAGLLRDLTEGLVLWLAFQL